MSSEPLDADHATPSGTKPEASPQRPFAALAGETQTQHGARAAITAAYLLPEPEAIAALLPAASLASDLAKETDARARRLVEALRGKATRSGVEALIHEYDLSSAEGVALMCLAEALLRIPDAATRDALIRDKIGHADWLSHLGHSRSLFVNAATWGLVVTGKLSATASEHSLTSALARIVAKGGEPLIRSGVDLAMRLMGEQFVMAHTIAEALEKSRTGEAAGFSYSFDMLGEAALTKADAERYFAAYVEAAHAIGKAAAGRPLHAGPGLSIKLSALHPRYQRSQRGRVMAELLPKVAELARHAKSYGIGINIDAEEVDRLDLSLDILEALVADESLAGWDGLGFVVQAYQKRARAVIDHVVELAKGSGRRLMVRLVKGAYWDTEIKRAQVAGLAGFPVFTRKVHTDVSYLACAGALLEARAHVYPQFATHNAQTLSSVMAMAGPDFTPGDYEFQCLFGMGEPLYEEVVAKDKLARPCRIYAPVGSHETLLAYLVRRLLENGANTSFVHRIADASVSIDELVRDPAEATRAITPPGSSHPGIRAPSDLFRPERANAAGLDLSNEASLAQLARDLAEDASSGPYAVAPFTAAQVETGPVRALANPAVPSDILGEVREATPELVTRAVADAAADSRAWAHVSADERAAKLEAAADLMEQRTAHLIGLMVREAGKSLSNAIGEVREAVDFLRYYAAGARAMGEAARPLGPVAAISPWNFPLSIFTGQVAAALAAGNPVIAKPAEETPLTAAAAAEIFKEAGIGAPAFQLLFGDGRVGAALVEDRHIAGVLFTGSTEVARQINRTLARRLGANGRPVPFVAETGGQNAMIVDSSALPEQMVMDAIVSAFDSAGQRCSALRLLCLQEDVADTMLAMLRGAMDELVVGDPARLSTDVGPVITGEAQRTILAHIEAMRGRGHKIHQTALPEAYAGGLFVPPTLIEIDKVAELEREVFGPVLHVVRFKRKDRNALVAAINATGYALTFGLHTRIDETIAEVGAKAAAGNIYVNRSIIGAVVGSQPFGGHHLSGTGPKAGGPLYLPRLCTRAHVEHLPRVAARETDPATELMVAEIGLLALHLEAMDLDAMAARVHRMGSESPLGGAQALPGPVGEANTYSLARRGRILCRPATREGCALQLAAAFATGNDVALWLDHGQEEFARLVPHALQHRHVLLGGADEEVDAALYEGEAEGLLKLLGEMAASDGPIRPVFARATEELAGGEDYPLHWLVRERTVSVNTAAAGGNATLMTLA